MNRKIVISIIIILSILLGVLVGFYFYIKNAGTKEPIDPNNNNVSFFGTSSPGNINLPSLPGQPTQQSTTSTSTEYFTPADWRLIWDKPVSGFGFTYTEVRVATTSTKSKTILIENIKLVDRASGNIHQTSTSTPLAERLSNTTYPRTEESLFLGLGGTELLLRRLATKGDTIESTHGTLQMLTTTSTAPTLTTKNLASDLLFASVSPDKSRIAYITSNPNERLISTKPDGSGKVVLWSSPLQEFIPYWISKDSIILHSKASAFAPSFVYSINPTTKAIRKLPLGTTDRGGFTATVRSDLKKAIISYLGPSDRIVTAVKNIDSSDELPLYISTLAEKCIWSKKNIDIVICAAPEAAPQGEYPDVWYQGNTVFEDNIWKINTRTGESRLIFRPLDYFIRGLDIQKMELNRAEDYLIFQDRVSLNLWGLRVNIEAPTSTRSR